MNAAAWAGTVAGAIVAALCIVAMRRLHHAPGWAHPWLSRAVIALMYIAGCALALTALGSWVVSLAEWATASAGGLSAQWVHGAVMVGAALLLVDVIIALWKAPDPEQGFPALLLPFLAVMSAGHLHGLLTVFPALQWCQDIAHWMGG